MVASTGALADPALAERLVRAAHAELWIASGAVAGLDGLLAARTAGLNSVRFTSLKPPVSWRGTPAEKHLDESASRRRIVFFEGTAREAAALYPQNANVAAAIALASLGLDCTQVQVGSDPHIEGPVGIIDAAGAFGTFHFEMLGRASATNPKTSAITGHSLACALAYGMCFRALDLLRAEVLRSR
jgi:aspartate dehydrogenase